MSLIHCRDLDIRLVWFGIFLKSTDLMTPSSMAFRIRLWTRLVDRPRALAMTLMLYPSRLSLIMAGASRLRSGILIMESPLLESSESSLLVQGKVQEGPGDPGAR